MDLSGTRIESEYIIDMFLEFLIDTQCRFILDDDLCENDLKKGILVLLCMNNFDKVWVKIKL